MDWGVRHATVAPRLTDSYYQKWMLQWLRRVHQECLINTHSEEADTGLKSFWQGCFQPDGCLESCKVTAGGKGFGIGVWLCFICCPLQGGSNLQPTNEPVNPKPVPLNLNPKKLFMTSDWAGRWHYQLDSCQTKLQVYQPSIPSVLEVFRFGIWSHALRRGRG